MANGQLNGVIQNLRRSALMSDEGGLTDAQLLDAFILHAEEAAFEALVRRHAPMVWGVCLRVLGHSHDAEDAFQACFLVLVRKADSIWPRAMVGNWLYGVACRTALKAKGVAAKRRAREKQVDDMPAKEVHDEKVWSDLKPLLDRELDRLADKYRVPVVLCDLEGKSQREAARQLGWPEGTLMTRLTRIPPTARQTAHPARHRPLRRRAGGGNLAKHGIGLCAGAARDFNHQGRDTDRGRSSGDRGDKRFNRNACRRSNPSHVPCKSQKRNDDRAGGRPARHRRPAWEPTKFLPADRRDPNKPPSCRTTMPTIWRTNSPSFRSRVVEGGREGGRKPDGASLTGKIVAVATDGKSFTVEAPAAARGEEAGKREIKINDKTTLTFSAVGAGGAKITAGYVAQVWLAEGSKDTAARAIFMAKIRTDREPDFQGKVAGVSKDGSTLSFELPPKERGAAPITKDIKITGKTMLTYSGVAKGGTTPTEGYAAGVWFVKGSKDTADSIHFSAGKGPERGARNARKPDSAGSVVAVSKDGKTVSLTVGAKERGGEVQKVDYKIDDKTQIHFNNIGPNGDKIAEGYNAVVWLADGSKDTAGMLIVNAPKKDRHTTVHGKVVAISKDGKSFTIEAPSKARGEEPKKMDITLSATTRIVYMGVGLDGARLTEGYTVEVTLEDGSQTNALQSGDCRRQRQREVGVNATF